MTFGNIIYGIGYRYQITDSLDTDSIEIGYRYSIQYMVWTFEDKHKTY